MVPGHALFLKTLSASMPIFQKKISPNEQYESVIFVVIETTGAAPVVTNTIFRYRFIRCITFQQTIFSNDAHNEKAHHLTLIHILPCTYIKQIHRMLHLTLSHLATRVTPQIFANPKNRQPFSQIHLVPRRICHRRRGWVPRTQARADGCGRHLDRGELLNEALTMN